MSESLGMSLIKLICLTTKKAVTLVKIAILFWSASFARSLRTLAKATRRDGVPATPWAPEADPCGPVQVPPELLSCPINCKHVCSGCSHSSGFAYRRGNGFAQLRSSEHDHVCPPDCHGECGNCWYM